MKARLYHPRKQKGALQKTQINSNTKWNGNMPAFIYKLPERVYACVIDGYMSTTTSFGDKIIVKVRIVEDEGYNITFNKYYDLDGKGVILQGSPLADFLQSMGVLKQDKIMWESLINQPVQAEIKVNNKQNYFVGSIVPDLEREEAPNDDNVEYDFDDEEDYDE